MAVVRDRQVSSQFTSLHIPNTNLFSFLTTNLHEKSTDRKVVTDISSGASYTYRQLVGIVENVATRLAGLGLGREDVIATFCPNCIQLLVVFLATWRLGAVVACINPLLTAGEAKRQLELCEAVAVFTSLKLAATARQAAAATRCRDIFTVDGREGKDAFGYLAADTRPGALPLAAADQLTTASGDVAFILFSSGTTGLSKGVELSHANVMATILAMSHPSVRWSPSQYEVVCQPLSHCFGITVLLTSLHNGLTVLLMPRFHWPDYLKLINEYKLDSLKMVPPIAVLLAKSPLVDQYDLSSLRHVSSGGAKLDGDIEAAIKRRLGEKLVINQGYGMTETTCVCLLSPAPAFCPTPAGSVGLPLPATSVKVIDTVTRNDLGAYEHGEICTRGAQNMKAYLRNPTATADMVDRDGWLHTGDVGYYDNNGFFFVVARIKELIKYKAYQVAPAELEAVLLSHPDVVEAAVVGIADVTAGQLPAALVVTRPDTTTSCTDIEKFVAGKVASFKWLRGGVRITQHIPQTPTGKILRDKVAEQFLKAKL